MTRTARRARIVRAWSILALLATVALGCTARDIKTDYGKKSGESVNGTGALAAMFRQSGFRVSTWTRFSPRLEQAQVLVWFQDSYDPPQVDQRMFVEQWLSRGSNAGRTLVIVGRDFDAARTYWSETEGLVPNEMWKEAARRRAQSIVDWETQRVAIPRTNARWFVQQDSESRYRPMRLSGPWAEEIDASQTRIELQMQLVPPQENDAKLLTNPPLTAPSPLSGRRSASAKGRRPAPTFLSDSGEWESESTGPLTFEPLLTTERDDLLALRIVQTSMKELTQWPDWNGGQIIAVSNGSFLLNLPLANHEHRKLAAQLIDECGPPGKVIFLESGIEGLPVVSQETDDDQGGFELFRVWPLNAVLVHCIALGLLFCLARFPIFGRPRQLNSGPESDFFKHIVAVGEWLEKTGNVTYARQLIANYHSARSKESR